MEEKKSCNLSRSKNGIFSVPKEDVSSTKNKISSSGGQRNIGSNDITIPSLQPIETPRKSHDSPPFIGLAAGNESLSASSYGDIASPQAMSMEPLRNDTVESQEVSLVEKGQLVMAGLLCSFAVLKQPWQSRNAALNYLTEETLAFAMGRAVDQSTKVVGSVGPYLNEDGTLKSYRFYHRLDAGTVIYGAMESIDKLEKGQLLGLKEDVFLSKCGKFVLKKRMYVKKVLDAWKQLPYCNNVLPLSGVLMAGSGYIYQITERMQYDLRQAREKATLKELASTQNDDQWSYTMRNCAHIIRTILRGIVHLNRNNYQHYDIKEENVFANKPFGCKCDNILECTCSEGWDIRIGDFDTLSKIDRPETWICGTKFYRPPECEGADYDPKYAEPTYDSWSVLIILLHFCCGTARSTSEKQAKELPWLKNQECHYAKDRFKDLSQACSTNTRLSPMVRFAVICLEDNYKKRPTPEEMLNMCDTLCV